MGRIRTIKPEFPQSQSMGKVSRDARLLFVQLWTLVDDSGRTRAASRMLASLLYPYDDDAPKLIGRWLKELEDVGSITRYSVDGDDYLEVCKWSQHQKIDKPSKSKFPAREDSSNTRRTLDESSALDQGPRTEGPKDQGGASADSSKAERPDDVPEDLWQEWLDYRKAKRAPVTQRVLDSTRKTATAAGMTMQQAFDYWIANGQTGFFPPGKSGISQRPAPGSKLGQPSVEHPRGMPIPFESPLSPCHCPMCIAARERKGTAKARTDGEAAAIGDNGDRRTGGKLETSGVKQ